MVVCRSQLAIARDNVSVDRHALGANAQDPLIWIVVNIIVSDNNVVGVVEFNSIVPVSYFKTFNSNPSDWGSFAVR